jgi:hypothetical protein
MQSSWPFPQHAREGLGEKEVQRAWLQQRLLRGVDRRRWPHLLRSSTQGHGSAPSTRFGMMEVADVGPGVCVVRDVCGCGSVWVWECVCGGGGGGGGGPPTPV